MSFELRPYQNEANEALLTAVDGGTQRPAAVLPTGSGKTIIFSDLILKLRRREIQRVLVIAHRGELLEQAAEKIRAMAPYLKVGVVKGQDNKHMGCHVVIASVQTLSQRRPCKNPARLEKDLPRCGTCTRCTTLHRAAQIKGIGAVVIDEAHHAAAPTYKSVMQHFGGFTPMSEGGVPVFGFTATMSRQEGGLARVWQDVVYTREIADMIDDGYLVKPHAKQVVVPEMNLDKAKTAGGDFTQKSLAEMMLDADAMTDVAKAYQEYASDRMGIVFSPTVEVAEAMTTAFNEIGIPAETVWGLMGDDQRRDVLKRFKQGQTQVLSNCAVLTEGFDEPGASCLVVARPTKSAGLYIQMTGRVLRPAPGKTDALILDVTGVTTRHKLASVVDLTGKKDKKDKDEYEEEEEEDEEDEETEPEPVAETETGQLLDKEILRVEGWRDVDFGQMAGRKRARWLRTPKGFWFAKKGELTWFMVPSLEEGLWHVRAVQDKQVITPPDDEALPVDQMLRKIELMATAPERSGDFDDPDAPWRRRTDISPKQRQAAQKMGIEVPEGATKGGISDAMDSKRYGRRIDAYMDHYKRQMDKNRET